ncbi:MAG: tyrosine-type recombinase/integrase [Hyphomicrobiaceae bacterium]
MENSPKIPSPRVKRKDRAWNKGKAVGPKAALSADQVKLIRNSLAAGKEWRDLALFGAAIDTMLRAVDLLKLRVSDITDPSGAILDEFGLKQQKTGEPHRVALSASTKAVLDTWLSIARKLPDDLVFTGLKAPNLYRALSRRQYGQLVKKWATLARVADPSLFSTHSLRRTRAAYVYEQTRNIEVVKTLLGQKTVASTSAYLNIDKKRALDIGRKYEL